MTVFVRTHECFPESNPMRLFLGGFVAEADHAACPGGHHIPDVIGGWDCPCSCHRPTPENVETS